MREIRCETLGGISGTVTTLTVMVDPQGDLQFDSHTQKVGWDASRNVRHCQPDHTNGHTIKEHHANGHMLSKKNAKYSNIGQTFGRPEAAVAVATSFNKL